ncbi:phosphatidylethanolamine-binding domain protein [Enterobacter hormaechei subsp. xiangfangensis]|nr:phosphatidylethanolamine-binding domain protein [Enterobacter hormaechei subsp. xiangfangensis]
MKIISKDLRDGEKLPERHVFNGMGYQGDNISPHLAWDDVPAGTKSFVVLLRSGAGPAPASGLPAGFGKWGGALTHFHSRR